MIRGECFPALADHVLIHYDRLYCNPNDIRDGDIVYCDTHHILQFKNILNRLEDLTIITHNSDAYLYDTDIPDDDQGIDVDELVCYSRWFGQNSYTEKVIPIPIGFENKRWEKVFGPKSQWLSDVKNRSIDPESLVYLNCNISTRPKDRGECYRYADGSEIVDVDRSKLDYIEYLTQIKRHKYTLCPRGHGLDCHRTWEVLMMGRVPILIREGQMERLYKGLPVLFIDGWENLNNIDLNIMFDTLTGSGVDDNYTSIDFWMQGL